MRIWPLHSTSTRKSFTSHRSGFKPFSDLKFSGFSRYYLSSTNKCEDHALKISFDRQFKNMNFIHI